MTETDPEDLADALLDGPWQRAAIEIRLARLRGLFLIGPDAEAFAAALLRRHPDPPPRPDLVDYLREPPGLLDPRYGLEQLCRVLAIDRGELDWFADRQGRSRRARTVLQHYRWRAIPKRDGVRVVAAPKPRLKEIQRRLLTRLTTDLPLHDSAHGGVAGRSVATALRPHAGARVLIRLDLESFFPTVTAARVRGLLEAVGAAPAVADVVTGLCTAAVPIAFWRDVPRPREPALLDAHWRLGERLRRPHLPQGAPTSGQLANAVTFGLDRRLAALARRFGGTYTRYVDDLVFSGGGFLQTRRHRFVDAATEIVLAEGFTLAERKTAVLTHAGRLGVLGAVVNVRPTLPRPERDRLRAIVHNCAVRGPAGEGVTQDQLRGRIAAVAALDPRLATRLKARFDEIDWAP
jgi:hypothetical protein